MFGYNYKFEMNPAKQTIKLRPTLGTYAKAFGPVVVIWAVLAALVAADKIVTNEKTDDSESTE